MRVDLSGKTVIPAMINVHVHIGYEGYTSWGAANDTPENVLDHLQREAFYGVGAAQSVGSSPVRAVAAVPERSAGRQVSSGREVFLHARHGAARRRARRGAAGGHQALHVINEVSTPQEARAAVQAMVAKHIPQLKIWVDDRRGTYPKMTPDVVDAVIDEAHRHRMLVNAHATTLPDQKTVVRAGADVLVHVVQNEKRGRRAARAGERKEAGTGRR